jgi:biopolymer transport protein ExbD
MRFRSSNQTYLTAFSYASLTDVVLQLLIFFLLTSAYVIQSGVRVQLPTAVTGERGTKAKIIVSVNAEGVFFLNSRQVTRDQLKDGVHTLLTEQADPVIVLQADKTVSLQMAVEAMDIVKAAGGSKFLIATEPVE